MFSWTAAAITNLSLTCVELKICNTYRYEFWDVGYKCCLYLLYIIKIDVGFVSYPIKYFFIPYTKLEVCIKACSSEMRRYGKCSNSLGISNVRTFYLNYPSSFFLLSVHFPLQCRCNLYQESFVNSKGGGWRERISECAKYLKAINSE